jgi:rfaE bifunctional protein kinase chain/domain
VRLSRLQEILNRFSQSHVMVLGDCMLDAHIWGQATRISPEAPVMVIEEERTTYAAGGASNVAANLVSMGAQASIVAVVGDDWMAQRLREQLAFLGIPPDGPVADPGRPTTTKTRILAQGHQVVRVDRESSCPISASLEEALLNRVRCGLRTAGALLLSDYDKGVMSERLVAEAVRLARKARCPVLCNAKPANIAFFRDLDLLTVNQSEARAITGLVITDETQLRMAGDRLRTLTRSHGVLITLGGQGIALFDRDGGFDRVAGITEEVYDVAGAGDSVIAAAALALVAGATLAEAATIANYAGNAKVRKLGVVPVTRSEIRAIWSLAENGGMECCQRRDPLQLGAADGAPVSASIAGPK